MTGTCAVSDAVRRYVDHEARMRAEEQEALAEAAREVRAMRGRWLVVYEGGGATRCRSRRRAHGAARAARDLGVPARVIRYRSDRVTFDATMPELVVNDSRWFP